MNNLPCCPGNSQLDARLPNYNLCSSDNSGWASSAQEVDSTGSCRGNTLLPIHSSSLACTATQQMPCLCLSEALEASIVPVLPLTFSSALKHQGPANKSDISPPEGLSTSEINTDRCRFPLLTNHLGKLSLSEGTESVVTHGFKMSSGLESHSFKTRNCFSSPFLLIL